MPAPFENRHRPSLASTRLETAEAAFEEYDFGPRRPHSATGWRRSGDNRLTRHVQVAAEDGKSIELFFSVDFKPSLDTVAAAYAVAWEPDMVEPKKDRTR